MAWTVSSWNRQHLYAAHEAEGLAKDYIQPTTKAAIMSAVKVRLTVATQRICTLNTRHEQARSGSDL